MERSVQIIVLLCISYFVNVNSELDAERPVILSEYNWSDLLEGEWMVEFMAPWCPACRGFTSTWENFAKTGDTLGITVAVVDVTENPGLSGRFLVTALPTLYHVKDGVFRQYLGGRKEQDLQEFVEEKKWESVHEVSWWTAPTSPQMSVVSVFFKAAMRIRTFYTFMTEDYGIPEWGCYLIFALLTIAAGLLLGLVIVCCCDLIFPTKYPPHDRKPPSRQDATDGEESDLIDDTKQNEGNEDSQTRLRRPVKSDEKS